MAPEVKIEGEKVGTKADVFSLGLILHELFCNCLPFNIKDKLSMISDLDKPLPLKFEESASKDVVHLTKRMLTLDHKFRPTIEQVLETPLIKKYLALMTSGQMFRPEIEELVVA